MRFVTAALAWLALAGAALAQPAPQIGQPSKDSVWVPTPERMIRRLMQLADVSAADVVVDLGSGDGRMPIYAAKHFGARAVGVELEENLVALSIREAKAQGVSHLTHFVRQDLFEADLSEATVVALYISPGVMTRLKPRLLALRPGTRVVSHQFRLDGWEPDESVRVEDRDGYLWVVPADVRGAWSIPAAQGLRIEFEQDHQKLRARGQRGGKAVIVIGLRLRGTELRFTAFDADGAARNFTGRVQGNRMEGSSEGLDIAPLRWSATRD